MGLSVFVFGARFWRVYALLLAVFAWGVYFSRNSSSVNSPQDVFFHISQIFRVWLETLDSGAGYGLFPIFPAHGFCRRFRVLLDLFTQIPNPGQFTKFNFSQFFAFSDFKIGSPKRVVFWLVFNGESRSFRGFPEPQK